MAYADTRHAKYQCITSIELSNLSINSWHIHTELLPDEALSSWLIRAGLRHAIEPLAIGRIIWGHWRVWTRDIDRWLPNQRLEELSQEIQIHRDLLYHVTLTPWTRQMSLSPLNPQQRWYWVTSLSHRNRSRQSSFAFCPHCLAEDDIPYMRKSWRFSWVTTCPTHKTILSEACPHCHYAVNLSRHTLSSKSLRYCTSCHGDLTAVSNQAVASKQSHETQGQLIEALYAKEPVAQDFTTLKFLIKLIRQSLASKRNMHNSPLHTFINIANDTRSPLCSICFTELSIKDRHALLTAAFKLMSLKDSSLVDLLIETGVTQSAFLKDKTELSNKILRISKQLPTHQRVRLRQRDASIRWPEPRSLEATQRLIKILHKSIRADDK